MKVLLDTHAYVWWETDDPRLSGRAREVIASGETEVFLSAASAWEIATKVRLGKWPAALALSDLEAAIRDEAFLALPITLAHARLAGTLPGAHRDPFDRMLAAQAHIEGVPLVTADPAFAGFGTRVLW